MKNKTTKKGSHVVGYAVLGASLAALAATSYFFLGPKGKKHQKQVRSWAIKMKGDVIEKLEKAREISEPVYHQIIESVAREYEKGKKASHGEINALVKDLKKHWKTISRSAQMAKSGVVKEVKKVVSKVRK